MFYKCLPESQIGIRFAVLSSRFRVTDHFETIAMNIFQNDIEHCEVKGARYMSHYYPRPKFHSIVLYGQPFSCYKPVCDKCVE